MSIWVGPTRWPRHGTNLAQPIPSATRLQRCLGQHGPLVVSGWAKEFRPQCLARPSLLQREAWRRSGNCDTPTAHPTASASPLHLISHFRFRRPRLTHSPVCPNPNPLSLSRIYGPPPVPPMLGVSNRARINFSVLHVSCFSRIHGP
jgi:hypothetical protein